MLMKVFGTRSVSTTDCHTLGFSAANHSLACRASSSDRFLVISFIASPILFPALKSDSWRTMYAAETPARLADSGWPSPDARWQEAHPSTPPSAPCATTFGIGACSPGNQSGGFWRSSILSCVYDLVLPGTCSGPLLSSI